MSYIYSTSSKNNFGGSTELDIGSSNANKILIRAPMFTGYASTIQVPLNAHVDSAFLSLYQYSNTSTGKVEVYRLTRDWTEGTSSNAAGNVCWDSAKVGAAWDAVGANNLKDREPVKTCETQVNSLNAWTRWDVTSLVQVWVSGVTNDGIILSDQDGDLTTTLIKYYSSEYAGNKALRPKLVVYYDPDTVTIVKQEGTTPLSQTWDTYLNETSGAPQGYNYGINPNLVLNSTAGSRKHILVNYKDLISDNANSILTGATIKKAVLLQLQWVPMLKARCQGL